MYGNRNSYSNFNKNEENGNGIKVIILLIAIIAVFIYLYNTDDSVRSVFKKIGSIGKDNTLEKKDEKKVSNKTSSDVKQNNNENENKEENKIMEDAITPNFEITDTAILLTKSLNMNNRNTYSDAKGEVDGTGLSVKIENGKPSLIIDWNTFKNVSGLEDEKKSEYKITGTKDKIFKGFVGRVGDTIKDTYIFIENTDGEVMYFKLFNKDKLNYNKNKEFKLSSPIHNVSKINEFYTANSCDTNNVCDTTTLARISSGSFYDLGLFIKSY